MVAQFLRDSYLSLLPNCPHIPSFMRCAHLIPLPVILTNLIILTIIIILIILT